MALPHALQLRLGAAGHLVAPGQGRRGTSATRLQQEAERKEVRAAFPEDTAIHVQVPHDVLPRLASGEKQGFPRLQRRNRSHAFTYTEYGHGAHLDNGALVLSKIGRSAVRWSRPVVGAIKTVTIAREADGWYITFFCADVLRSLHALRLTGREPGSNVGLTVSLLTAQGKQVESPATAAAPRSRMPMSKNACAAGKKGRKRRKKARRLVAKQQQKARRQRQDLHSTTGPL